MGSHTRVTPTGFNTSTRVVSSKVRQAAARPDSGSAMAAVPMLTFRTKSRRVIVFP